MSKYAVLLKLLLKNIKLDLKPTKKCKRFQYQVFLNEASWKKTT